MNTLLKLDSRFVSSNLYRCSSCFNLSISASLFSYKAKECHYHSITNASQNYVISCVQTGTHQKLTQKHSM